MKEKFMEQQMEYEGRGGHDAFIHDLARVTCEEFIPDVDHVCPNCYLSLIHISEPTRPY